MSPPPGAYVRIAEPKEHDEAAWVLTRAFAHDPAMNWYGCVKEMFPADQNMHNLDALPKEARRTLQRLYTFQRGVLEATVLSGGFVTVVAIPNSTGGEQAASQGREVIVATTLWLKPGQPMDFSIMTTLRAGLWRVLFSWGVVGSARLQINFIPAVERSLRKSFASRNLDRWDSWHLLEMTVDPQYQGTGLCGLMMRDGFERTKPKPVHLEATTPRSREIYTHYGFEVDEEHQFGRGAVDTRGVAAKGSAATGYPEWIMTKWTYT